MSRAAVPSAQTTSYVDLGTGRRAVLDLDPRHGDRSATVANALPVLLVPGFTGSKEDFTPLLERLARDRRVVAVDLAGQWESDGPEDPAAYLPDPLGAELVELLDALDIARAHLVGHSYGGLVSRAAVIAAADRWSSLTLLCSGPHRLEGERRAATDLVAQLAAAMPLPELYDGMIDYWTQHGQPLPPEEARDFQRSRFAAGVPASVVGMARGLLEEPDRVDTLQAAAATGGVALAVVFGADDDAWLPSEQEAMAARLGVSPHVIAGAGHSPAYENPEATLEMLTRLLAAAD